MGNKDKFGQCRQPRETAEQGGGGQPEADTQQVSKESLSAL